MYLYQLCFKSWSKLLCTQIEDLGKPKKKMYRKFSRTGLNTYFVLLSWFKNSIFWCPPFYFVLVLIALFVYKLQIELKQLRSYKRITINTSYKIKQSKMLCFYPCLWKKSVVSKLSLLPRTCVQGGWEIGEHIFSPKLMFLGTLK